MNQLKIPFVLVFVLFVCGLAWGSGRQGGDQGRGLARGHSGGQGNSGAHGFNGGQGHNGGRGFQIDEGFGGPPGRNGRQSNGGQGDKKYRSNLYSDDDVYGYDATYPNGEASYINYKSKDARARRGPEFARTSRAYSRQGGSGSGGRSNFGQENEYKGGGGAGGRGGGGW